MLRHVETRLMSKILANAYFYTIFTRYLKGDTKVLLLYLLDIYVVLFGLCLHDTYCVLMKYLLGICVVPLGFLHLAYKFHIC